LDLYPDTNLILYYFQKGTELKRNVNLIFNNDKYNISIIPSIQIEYERKINFNEIRTFQEKINEIYDLTNSGIKIKEKIQDLLNENNSIYLEELLREIKLINNADLIMSTSNMLKNEFRNVNGTITIKYVDENESKKINLFKEKESSFINEIHKRLKVHFPEEKENDKYDNEHIINSVILTKLRKNQLSYFVSDDHFRRYSNTNKYYVDASNDIKNDFHVNLEVKYFPELITEIKSKI